MQQNSDQKINFSDFSDRTDVLAEVLNVSIAELAPMLPVSVDMMMGYRTGRYPISDKAWRKLKAAELRLLAKTAPEKAISAIEDSLLLKNYGTRPLDQVMSFAEEQSVEKIATALLHAAEVVHVWKADTEALTDEYMERLEALARGQKLSKEAKEELPKLTQTVRRRREKLPFLGATILQAITLLAGQSKSGRAPSETRKKHELPITREKAQEPGIPEIFPSGDVVEDLFVIERVADITMQDIGWSRYDKPHNVNFETHLLKCAYQKHFKNITFKCWHAGRLFNVRFTLPDGSRIDFSEENPVRRIQEEIEKLPSQPSLAPAKLKKGAPRANSER